MRRVRIWCLERRCMPWCSALRVTNVRGGVCGVASSVAQVSLPDHLLVGGLLGDPVDLEIPACEFSFRWPFNSLNALINPVLCGRMSLIVSNQHDVLSRCCRQAPLAFGWELMSRIALERLGRVPCAHSVPSFRPSGRCWITRGSACRVRV